MSANQPLLTNPDEELSKEVVRHCNNLLNIGLHKVIKRLDERLIFSDL